MVSCEIVWKVSAVDPGRGVATVPDEVLMVVLVVGLEVIINHIGINDEDMMGSSVGYFDGTTHGKIPVGSWPENILKKKTYSDMVGSRCGP